MTTADKDFFEYFFVPDSRASLSMFIFTLIADSFWSSLIRGTPGDAVLSKFSPDGYLEIVDSNIFGGTRVFGETLTGVAGACVLLGRTEPYLWWTARRYDISARANGN